MNYFLKISLFCGLCILLNCSSPTINDNHTDVLVIGEGTGATAAAIQAARSGAKTTLVLPISWLGGMLTAAGVSATDGNHQLPSGLWGEFRDSLRKHYGGADALFTGWVSNTMFEPSVGDYYWKQIVKKEANLSIHYNTKFETLTAKDGLWEGQFSKDGQFFSLKAKVVIDGTDLGDIAAKAGATYDIGMDNRRQTGEAMAPPSNNDIIQDLTYAAILKDYGIGEDKTIPKPAGYDGSQFYCSCEQKCTDTTITTTVHPCDKMLSYGKLPNNKYMINWPLKGNDYYANIIEKKEAERQAILEKAKNKTLQFIYYIQTELGYKHLGIADDEFPSKDGLPLMPYHREGRRIHGLVQLNINHILKPYDFPLYRTGIAVGDYPVDHHHYERPDAPEIDFPYIPSFNIPIGALIPKNVNNFIIADKAISVTNIVNGASRLQPVIIQIGQVAGIMGATAALSDIEVKDLDIRKIQTQLLQSKAYLLPFIDIKPDHPHFEVIQKIGATGLLKGKGIPYKWANQTWFYPDSTIAANTFYENLQAFDSRFNPLPKENALLTFGAAIDLLATILKKEQIIEVVKKRLEIEQIEMSQAIKRQELAILLDELLKPFERSVDVYGEMVEN